MINSLVIIPHFNKVSLLKDCIKYLIQNDGIDFDIMIVDNGSTDESQEYINYLTNNYKSIYSILLTSNTGFAYAVNRGIEYSINNGYNYSILLNNDAFVDKSFVKNIENCISNSSNVFAVSSLMLSYKDKSIIDSYGDYYTILGWSFQGHIGERTNKINKIDKIDNAFSACAGAAIYSNSILKDIGLFDETFFAYLEDVDISYRARLYGYKILACSDAVCYHLGSATTGSKYNTFKVRTSARNNIYLIYKNMPFLQLLLNIVPLLIGHIIKLIFFVFRGFGLSYINGIIDGFKNLHKIKKINYNKCKFINFINIEIELIINQFKYIANFIKRHI